MANQLTLLNYVKTTLRIALNNESIDEQLEDLINAAILDMENTADIAEVDTSDSLVRLAIVTFVKVHWTTNSSESEKLQKSYDSLKDKLALSTAYGDYPTTSEG